jgi:hypothetical protein
MPEMKVSVVDTPDASLGILYVVANRAPLRPNPLAKLPLGSVRANGWIRHQLDLMAAGQVGRLREISAFLADDNGWFGTEKDGWEEQPYWFRGFHNLGVLIGDARIRAESARWIEAMISTAHSDGYFGPPAMKRVVGENGSVVVDLWPHMVMLDALRSHWEATRDGRVIELMTRFFAFCRDIPEEQFVPSWIDGFGNWRPFIQWTRSGDMLPHIHWLYNITGDEWLLPVATRFHDHVEPPGEKWLHKHVVHFTQRFREPGNYFAQSNDPKHLAETEYWYDMHMAEWGQQPGGAFGADENIREGKTDPKQGTETCAFAEFNKSFFILGQITGQSMYADRAEDIQFNSFPASQTPDLKALHYLTAGNQPQLDASGNHDYQNRGRQINYSPHDYRCCQHNVAMGWPYFVEHMWMAAAGDGLCAWMYGPCEVTAKIGAGHEVTIVEKTTYPFDTSVRMTLSMKQDTAFPLYLRVPKWCNGFTVTLNGRRIRVDAEPGKYVLIEREWSDGDVIEIEMPVELSTRVWQKHGGALTVDRGPLTYSLRIGEDWRKMDSGTEEWPEWEVFPTSPWNYGLIPGSVEFVSAKPVADQPWTLENAPIALRAKGKRIPNWQLIDETITDLQPGPIRSDQPKEEITLIPMGCARLRLTCFPAIGEGPEAKEWVKVGSHEEAMKLRLGT